MSGMDVSVADIYTTARLAPAMHPGPAGRFLAPYGRLTPRGTVKRLLLLCCAFGIACSAPQPAGTAPLAMPRDQALDDTLAIPLGGSAVTSDNTVRVTVRSKL